MQELHVRAFFFKLCLFSEFAEAFPLFIERGKLFVNSFPLCCKFAELVGIIMVASLLPPYFNSLYSKMIEGGIDLVFDH